MKMKACQVTATLFQLEEKFIDFFHFFFNEKCCLRSAIQRQGAKMKYDILNLLFYEILEDKKYMKQVEMEGLLNSC